MSDEERAFLVGIKRPARYGTTTTPAMKAKLVQVMKHTVLPTDTLQGISLKYGASMVEIKRMNKLWSNDSLYLRDTLDIPIYDTSSSSTPTHEFAPPTNSSEARFNGTFASSSKSPGSISASANSSVNLSSNSKRASLTDHANTHENCDKSEMSLDDILSRIDSSIKITAKNVKQLAKNSSVDMVDSAWSNASYNPPPCVPVSASVASLDNVSLNDRSPSPTEVKVTRSASGRAQQFLSKVANGRNKLKQPPTTDIQLQTLQDEMYQL